MVSESSAISYITSKTMVPISLVVSLIGGGGWLTKVHSTVEKNAEKIEELVEERKDSISILRDINKRLSRIEGKLGVTTE